MHARAVRSALLDLIVPSSCGGCGRPGPALCQDCAALLEAPLPVRLAAAMPPVFALGRYDGPLRTALLAYKERGRRELAVPFGAAVAAALRQLATTVRPPADGWWLVPAPSRPSQARRRGGDHVARLAATAAAAIAAAGTPAAVAPALCLGRGVRDSVGLDKAARSANLAGRVKIRQSGLPPAGGSVLLLDDVITTGATAAACTAALTAAGLPVRAVLALAVTMRTAGSPSPGVLYSAFAK